MSPRLPIILAAAVLSLWLPSQALAVDPDGSLRPVAITAKAGTISARVSPIPVLVTGPNDTGGHIRVDNISGLIEDVAIGVADYAIDAAGTPIAAPADFPFGSAAWYAFDTPAFSLPAGTSRDIPFHLVVPAGAGAGDHFAALSVTVQAQPGQPGLATDGTQASSVLVFQSRLQHRIEGAQPQTPTVELTGAISDGGASFVAHVANGGNTVVGHQADPTPTLTLFNVSPWGDGTRAERTIPVRGFYVAPKSVRDVPVDWVDLPLIGQYRAVFTLPAADGQPQVTAETTLTVVNAPVLVGLAVVLVLGLLLVTILVVRRRAR